MNKIGRVLEPRSSASRPKLANLSGKKWLIYREKEPIFRSPGPISRHTALDGTPLGTLNFHFGIGLRLNKRAWEWIISAEFTLL